MLGFSPQLINLIFNILFEIVLTIPITINLVHQATITLESDTWAHSKAQLKLEK